MPPTRPSLDRYIGSSSQKEEKEVKWFNIGNSCREMLKEFSNELSENLDINIQDYYKKGDFKSAMTHILSKSKKDGRFGETLNKLMEAIWNHAQCLLHRKTTTKQQATTLYMWAWLFIKQVLQLVEN